MINLLTAIDYEATYWKWLRYTAAARRLDARCPDDTRKVFTQLYRAFAREYYAVVPSPSGIRRERSL